MNTKCKIDLLDKLYKVKSLSKYISESIDLILHEKVHIEIVTGVGQTFQHLDNLIDEMYKNIETIKNDI